MEYSTRRDKLRLDFKAEIWAFATTMWEIFSRGRTPTVYDVRSHAGCYLVRICLCLRFFLTSYLAVYPVQAAIAAAQRMSARHLQHNARRLGSNAGTTIFTANDILKTYWRQWVVICIFYFFFLQSTGLRMFILYLWFFLAVEWFLFKSAHHILKSCTFHFFRRRPTPNRQQQAAERIDAKHQCERTF